MSSWSDQPSANRLHAAAQDELALLALGEPIRPELQEHVADCARCGADLAELRSTARLGRTVGRPGAGEVSLPPPEAVWDRICADLGTDDGSGTPASRPPVPAPGPVLPAVAPAVPLDAVRSRRRILHRGAGLLAAAVLVVAAGLAGWGFGRHDRPHPPVSAGRAALSAQPGTSAAARGTAVMRPTAEGYQLDLQTSGLPAPAGYYEVWLYDPSINQMVAIGTLGTGARGTFTVPAGIDTRAYHVVDVSYQRFDGNPSHQRSVLRGVLQVR